MNKGFFASCLIVATAAGLGYWIWSDAPSRTRKATISDVGQELAGVADASDQAERFTSREFTEIIDLSRVFEPTGEELSLHNLLESTEEIESLPLPREAEVLHSPREVGRTFPDAGEEASSPNERASLFAGPLEVFAAWHWAELLSNLLPLKGTLWTVNP